MIRSPLLLALALAACSSEPAQPPLPGDEESAPAAADKPPAAATVAEETGRAAQYTRLGDCRVVRKSDDEMPFVESLCAGPQGWALKMGDSDERQTIAVVAPGGAETRLDTAGIGGGGFSSFGGTAEWRGPAGAAVDSLIVRYQVAEQPHPAPETSYLLAIRLGGAPCIVDRIAPGPGQNERARAAADGKGDCLRG